MPPTVLAPFISTVPGVPPLTVSSKVAIWPAADGMPVIQLLLVPVLVVQVLSLVPLCQVPLPAGRLVAVTTSLMKVSPTDQL